MGQRTLVLLEPSLIIYEDISILQFDFYKGLRENAIIWLLGLFVVNVEKMVVAKEQKLDVNTFIGILKERKQFSIYRSMPYLGIIPGIDWDIQGYD